MKRGPLAVVLITGQLAAAQLAFSRCHPVLDCATLGQAACAASCGVLASRGTRPFPPAPNLGMGLEEVDRVGGGEKPSRDRTSGLVGGRQEERARSRGGVRRRGKERGPGLEQSGWAGGGGPRGRSKEQMGQPGGATVPIPPGSSLFPESFGPAHTA